MLKLDFAMNKKEKTELKNFNIRFADENDVDLILDFIRK